MRWLIVSATVLVTFMTTMVGEGNAADAMNAEFRTMSECLEGIKKNSKQSLQIVTDKPTEVSGFLSNGQGFACQKKESGTKGTYYHGWFMVK
jgi:hypothetical protein